MNDTPPPNPAQTVQPLPANTIHLGDCLHLLPAIPDESVDMILCDLPYGTTKNPWDSVIDLEQLWIQYKRIAKPHAAIVLTGQMPFTAALVMSQPLMFRHHWVWEKTAATGHLNAKHAPMKAHEDVLVFSRKQQTYNPQKTIGHPMKSNGEAASRRANLSTNYGEQKHTEYASTERYPRSVQTFASDKQTSKLHPTQKPLALFEYLVRTYSNEGDLVLDNAIGSGTTAVAARNNGRHFIGMEKQQEYHAVAVARLDALAALDRLNPPGGWRLPIPPLSDHLG